MKAYFRIQNNQIVGISQFEYEDQTGFTTIEKELTEEEFDIAADIFVFENESIKQVEPSKFDDQGNKIK